MRIISATSRVCVGLICLGVSVWLIAYTLGKFPDRRGAVVEGRAALCENVALHCSLLASRNDTHTIETALDGLVARNRDVRSAAIRQPGGTLLVSVGPHEEHWKLPPGKQSTESQMRVPVLAGDTDWGTVEVRFADSSAAGAWAWINHPLVQLLAFVAAATYLLYFYYLRKVLQQLNPSRVIPNRVRQTLDTLAEGLLVLDKNERILLANRSFAEGIGASVDELTGRKASELPWETEEKRLTIESYPWQRALDNDSPQLGDLLTIHDKSERPRILKVSALPVYGEDGGQRGTMASFDDVTEIEQSRVDLRKMVDSLSESRDEIHRQNLELERLASHDSLTGCLTRRAFFPELDNHWRTSERHQYPLACMMIDLDHFKSINDTHGHQVGDLVLQKVAEMLHSGRRPSDLICRYGGEEFCVLLPHTDIGGANVVAEKIRADIECTDFNGVAVTASIGISLRSMGGRDPHEMIDQADKCLYVAKHEGRNRVVTFDQAIDGIAPSEQPSRTPSACDDPPLVEDDRDAAIPFHAVTALVSALAYRDPPTAEHCRRVADLCVATARRLMPTSQSYVLEIAALLHDVGKIAVPDSILLKPGKLTDEEWQFMRLHERIGTEIVQSTFSSPALAEMIRTYRAWYGGNSQHPELPTGDDIPLAARILAIADAYDSMTNRSAYRDPLTREQAFAELNRCAVRQFDADVVERFMDAVLSGDGDKQSVSESSQAAALSCGRQIERLAEALDNHDLAGLAALAHRLNMTAAKYGATAIATHAAQLEEATSGDTDLKLILQLTRTLLDLCRSTQRAYLDEAVVSKRELELAPRDETATVFDHQVEGELSRV